MFSESDLWNYTPSKKRGKRQLNQIYSFHIPEMVVAPPQEFVLNMLVIFYTEESS
jgi:hypothetical protein